jgi:hypothetical protein
VPKYWAPSGTKNPDATKQEKLEKELEELLNRVSEDIFMQYPCVTEDLEEAKKATRKAVAIYRRYGFKLMTDSISITKQLECPNCGYLGRFSDAYCPKVEPS